MHKHVFFLPDNACRYLKYPHQQVYLPFSRATHNATSTRKPFSLKVVSSSSENLLALSFLSLLHYFPQFDELLQTTGFTSKHLFYISTFDYCLQMLNIQLLNERCQNAYFYENNLGPKVFQTTQSEPRIPYLQALLLHQRNPISKKKLSAF